MSSDTLQGADRSPASAPYSAFSHIDSLRNDNSLAPLALAHLCGQESLWSRHKGIPSSGGVERFGRGVRLGGVSPCSAHRRANSGSRAEARQPRGSKASAFLKKNTVLGGVARVK
jgi:endonuclease YncB( thermonuclease family)